MGAHCSAWPCCLGCWLGLKTACCAGGWLRGLAHCSAWSIPGWLWAGGWPMGLQVRIFSKNGFKIGVGRYLATGHFLVWHCIVCRVLLLEVLSWLLWCSARGWHCSAWSSKVVAGLVCSAWPLIFVTSVGSATLLLGACLAWHCSAWSSSSRSSTVLVGIGWAMEGCGVCSAWSLIISVGFLTSILGL